MAHKIIIQSKKGQTDSLKHAVNIFFTLAPKQTLGQPHDLVAFAGMHFSSDSEVDQSFSWDGDLAFATYRTGDHGGKKKCILGSDRSAKTPVGEMSILLANSTWVGPTSNPNTDHSCARFEFMRSTGRTLSLVKYITYQGTRVSLPVLTWHPTDEVVGSSPGFFLQAFAVSDATPDGTILGLADLKYPLFSEPLDCDAIPDSSTWMLTEDGNGKVSLEKPDAINPIKRGAEARLLEQSVEKLTNSFDNMKNQLDTLVKSLEDTRQRLLVVETTVGTNQTELREAQTSLTTARGEISRLGRIEPEVSHLVASFDRSAERLAAVETSATKAQEEVKALAGGRSELARLEASVQSTQKQISLVDASLTTIVDHRVSAVESKTSDLDESLCHIQDQLSAARTAAGTTRDRVDRLNRGVLAVQATTDILKASVDQDEDRLSALEESVGRVHQRLDPVGKSGGLVPGNAGSPRVPDVRRQFSGIQRPSSLAQDGSTAVDGPLSALRPQVATLDRRIPVVEAKMDRLERTIVIMERKLPALEGKAVRVEKLCEGTQDELAALQLSLVTTKEELTDLGSRLIEVETKISFPENWYENEPPSPGVFPSQSRLDPV